MREGDERTEPISWDAALGLMMIGVAMLVHLRAWTFVCDDAYISFRYARNLAEHGQLVYNLAPYERVEGYTNLLWVLLLGLGDVLGLSPERLAPVLTATASLAALLLVALIGNQLRARFGPTPGPRARLEVVDLLAPALLVSVPEFVVWASSGLETSLAVCLSLLAAWSWLDGRIELAAGVAAASYLTRPDALVWIASFGIGWLVIVGFERRGLAAIPWRRVAIASAVFVLPLIAALVFRRVYYGAWLPNTWAVKQHGLALRDTYGLAYLRWWVDRLQLLWLAPLVLALRPRHLPVVLTIVAQLVWAWSIGGDFMAYGRFLLPATCSLALLISVAVAELRETLPRRWGDVAWVMLALMLVIGSAWQIPQRIAADRARAHLHVDEGAANSESGPGPGFESVDAMHRFAAIRVAAGEQLARQVSSDTLITVGAAGALPYASMLPAYDSYGLVDPGVVAVAKPQLDGARPGHQLHAPLDYMKSHEPDLMCHIGYAGQQLPPRGLDRRMRAGREWTGWACVETGAIADPRAPEGAIPSHYYCCMRPRDRFDALDERTYERGSE